MEKLSMVPRWAALLGLLAVLCGPVHASGMQLAAMGRLVSSASAQCGRTTMCCPAAVNMQAVCPHVGGTCCGGGSCCPSGFQCTLQAGAMSCAKLVAVKEGPNGQRQLLDMADPQARGGPAVKRGVPETIVQHRPDGSVVTIRTENLKLTKAERVHRRHQRFQRILRREQRLAKKAEKKALEKDRKMAEKNNPDGAAPPPPADMNKDDLPKGLFHRRRRNRRRKIKDEPVILGKGQKKRRKTKPACNGECMRRRVKLNAQTEIVVGKPKKGAAGPLGDPIGGYAFVEAGASPPARTGPMARPRPRARRSSKKTATRPQRVALNAQTDIVIGKPAAQAKKTF